MSKKKTLFGILLIAAAFSTLFITLLPSLYANNSAGKVLKEIKTDFSFLKAERSPYLLLYFGYVGCHNICPVDLSRISEIYSELDQDKFSFLFINLKEDTHPNSVDPFAKAFNKSFKGVYLNNEQIKDVIHKLNIKYLPSLINKDDIDHSGFLYVLKKENNNYTQKFLYTTRPFDKEFIVDDLQKL